MKCRNPGTHILSDLLQWMFILSLAGQLVLGPAFHTNGYKSGAMTVKPVKYSSVKTQEINIKALPWCCRFGLPFHFFFRKVPLEINVPRMQMHWLHLIKIKLVWFHWGRCSVAKMDLPLCSSVVNKLASFWKVSFWETFQVLFPGPSFSLQFPGV